MTGNIIARRYAKALFDLGSEAGGDALERYASSLQDINQALKSSPKLREAMTAPIFTYQEKSAVLAKLAKKLKLDKTILDFSLLVAEKNRMDEFPAIVDSYRKQLDEAKGIVRGTLTTAAPLDDEKQKTVLAELQKKTDRTLALEFGVAPEILGGVILKVGDNVRDASLRTQLSILKDSIKRGE